MNSFVYRWTNITLNKIYLGWHKGAEDDGYVCSSSSAQFWNDYNNPDYQWQREIIFKGTMPECQLLESQILDSLDIKSDNTIMDSESNFVFLLQPLTVYLNSVSCRFNTRTSSSNNKI
jgi:hypothetical protein